MFVQVSKAGGKETNEDREEEQQISFQSSKRVCQESIENDIYLNYGC